MTGAPLRISFGTIGRGQTLADTAYDSDALRRTLADRDAIAAIKPLA